MIVLNPYIILNDEAEEALNFYKGVFGGELSLSRYGESAGSMPNPIKEEHKELIMHGLLKTDMFQLMASDGAPTGGTTGGDNVSISLSGDDDATLSKYFESLSMGGKLTVPLEKAPWGDKFGMFTDKYGIHWMVNITANA